ncbi:MAG: cytochrome c [Planctomycetes bacterium]|nr:cytochrome c [Planctomycetota bacterium]
MKRITLFAALAMVALAALAAGCGSGDKPSGNGGKKADDKITRPEPPAEYKGKTNPTPDAVAEGKKVFDTNCATCHGPNGDGDSVAGKALTPPATDLTDAKLQDAVKDDYMYWHIAEGGAALGHTGMTPFKASLKEEQIWQVVAYIRSMKK